MNCPNCNKELFCHCESCKAQNIDKTPWLFKYENEVELQYCGACGYTDTPDAWFDKEIEQVLEAEGVNSLTELVNKKNGTSIQD
jgi:Zn ribbon nucleic-acid-binding protein